MRNKILFVSGLGLAAVSIAVGLMFFVSYSTHLILVVR